MAQARLPEQEKRGIHTLAAAEGYQKLTLTPCRNLCPSITSVADPSQPADIAHPTPADLPLALGSFEDHGSHDTRRDGDPTHDGRTEQALLCDLIVHQLPQALCLHVAGLELQQVVIVPSGLGVIPQLVVSQGEVVEAFAASVGALAEDVA